MQKSLSARIAERTGIKTPSRNAKNRAAFLAVRPDIKQAMDDGWPVKTIWETLHAEGKITFSYQAFRGYVNRIILPIKTEELVSPIKNELSIPVKADEKLIADKGNVPISDIQGFNFNPVPNLKELF